MAEKQLKIENMSKQDNNQTPEDIKNEKVNNGVNQDQGPIGKQNKGTPPSASKIYLPGFLKRKCITLGPDDQGPSMPKHGKMEPQLTTNLELTEEEQSKQQSIDPESTEPEATQSEQTDAESTDSESTTSEQGQNYATDSDSESDFNSDTDSDSSDSEADEPEPRPRVMTDPDFDAAVASVFTPMEPAVVVETLPVLTEIFTPMESDMLDVMPRPPLRPNAIARFAFAPVQLLETLEPRQRIAYCYCRRRSDIERLLRAKRRRELMMIRKPPLVLICRAYEHGVEAILSNSIQSSEDSIISSDLRTFVVAERLYTALDKSVAAIIFGINRYQKLLKGKMFTLVTDQPTFVKVFHPATLFQVVPEKWDKIANALSLFNYNIIYRPSPPKRNMSPSLMLMI